MRSSTTKTKWKNGKQIEVTTTTTTTTLPDGTKKTVVTKEKVEKPTAPSASTRSGSFCVHCGAKLEPGAKFCVQCGGKVSSPAPSSSSVSSPARSSYNPPPKSSPSTRSTPNSHSSTTRHHQSTSSGSSEPHLTPLGKQLKAMIMGPGTSTGSSTTHQHRSSPSHSSSSSQAASRIVCKTCGKHVPVGESYIQRKGRTYCEVQHFFIFLVRALAYLRRMV